MIYFAPSRRRALSLQGRAPQAQARQHDCSVPELQTGQLPTDHKGRQGKSCVHQALPHIRLLSQVRTIGTPRLPFLNRSAASTV